MPVIYQTVCEKLILVLQWKVSLKLTFLGKYGFECLLEDQKTIGLIISINVWMQSIVQNPLLNSTYLLCCEESSIENCLGLFFVSAVIFYNLFDLFWYSSCFSTAVSPSYFQVILFTHLIYINRPNYITKS